MFEREREREREAYKKKRDKKEVTFIFFIGRNMKGAKFVTT